MGAEKTLRLFGAVTPTLDVSACCGLLPSVASMRARSASRRRSLKWAR